MKSSSAFVAAGSFGQNPLPGLGSDWLTPTRTPYTDLRRHLSAARNVVFDERKPTIWRESGATVRPYRSTCSILVCVTVHMFRLRVCQLQHPRGAPVPATAVDSPTHHNKIPFVP